jgi:hypothetical protein
MSVLRCYAIIHENRKLDNGFYAVWTQSSLNHKYCLTRMQFNTVFAFTASSGQSSQSYNGGVCVCVCVCVCVFGRECKNFCRYVGMAQTRHRPMKNLENAWSYFTWQRKMCVRYDRVVLCRFYVISVLHSIHMRHDSCHISPLCDNQHYK